MKIVLDIIHGNKLQNEFMHCTDVFERGKILGDYERVTVTGTEDMKIQEIIPNLVTAYDKAGRIVSFMSIRSTDTPIDPIPEPYVRPMIQTVSNGNSFGVFRGLLEGLGYVVETDDYMNVTSVKYPKTKSIQLV